MQRNTLLPLLVVILGTVLALGYLGVQRAMAQPLRQGNSVITVDTHTDDLTVNGNCTLREAIQAANTDSAVDQCPAGNGMDEIILPTNGVALQLSGANEDNNATGDLDITEALTITGHGADQTFINALYLDRIFDIQFGTTSVVITGVHLFQGQVNSGLGGAISSGWSTNLFIYNSRITRNSSQFGGGGYGGGIYQYGGSLTLANTRVTTNTTNGHGGGIFVTDADIVWLKDVTINGNTTTGTSGDMGGGGAYFRDSVVELDGGEFSYNEAEYWGSGMHLKGTVMTQTGDVQIANNHSDDAAGGIYIGSQSTLTLNAAQIYSNTATHAGGIYINNGVLIISNADIMSNTISSFGGGINCGFGSVSLSNVRLVNNRANRGGAIYNNCAMTIDRTSIVSNVASNTAGGISNGGILTLTNSTLSGNSAVWAGGLYADSGSSNTLTYTSIISNSASLDYGVINNSGVVQLGNSLLAGNQPGNCAGTAPVSNGYNLDDGVTCSLSGMGDQSNVDAQVGALILDTGTYVHPLPFGSPAVDAAVCAAGIFVDQRGLARPKGPACDIGAYEMFQVMWNNYLPLMIK